MCIPLASLSFWTSSMSSTALTSNSRFRLPRFGLPPCLPLLQRPIRRYFSLLLDFLRAFRYFNVQSAAISRSFWTSSVPSAASTSNPPLFLAPFELPPCLPLLQRPIHRSFSLLFDFLRASLCSNVQFSLPASR